MNDILKSVDRRLFRHRVELASLIGGIGFLFFLFTPVHAARFSARIFELPEEAFVSGVYVALAFLNLAAAALRIWAGGTLGAARMMAIDVQSESLITAGPYGHVRNPIYLSDVMTLAGMGLVVPWPGSLTVWILLALIYPRLMHYEEQNLLTSLGDSYAQFQNEVPRFGWRMRAYRPEGEKVTGAFDWREGIANNFIYLPLIPGFFVCAATGTLWHGVAVGAIGPVAWIALHFWRNFKPGGLAEKAGGFDE